LTEQQSEIATGDHAVVVEIGEAWAGGACSPTSEQETKVGAANDAVVVDVAEARGSREFKDQRATRVGFKGVVEAGKWAVSAAVEAGEVASEVWLTW
jgi:hypothetical protein